MEKIKTALVSVSDKTYLDHLSQYLIKNNVVTYSTGGTYTELKKLGVPVKKVSELTNFPEVMDGRVKTLHPKIHMGLLARRGNIEDEKVLREFQGLYFDLLVVNLYPFEQKKEEGFSDEKLVEFIDVGGPSMIRAGAKNFERIVTLTSPEDYKLLSENNFTDIKVRKQLAGKAFKHLSTYDEQIYSWLLNDDRVENKDNYKKVLRYGENPHQQASWEFGDDNGLHKAEVLQGKELSFNNLIDLTAAVESVRLFDEEAACVSVKHNNPCGIGTGQGVFEAVRLSLAADPKSVFGGIVAVNREIDKKSAEELNKIFLECVVAPSFSKEALQILAHKKNLRVLRWPNFFQKNSFKDFKRVTGGRVVQDLDTVVTDFTNWNLKTGTEPDEETRKALQFSWKTVSRLKSNAIAVCTLNQSLGLGMGQVNRIDAVKSALGRWKEFHSNVKTPIVLASDAFFPFADSIELIANKGVSWVVQPGGSIKDEEVIAKAKELNINMFFTGRRHFLH